LLDDFNSHFRSRNERVAVLHVFAVGKQQYVTEGRGLARLNVEAIDINRVAFRDAKLPASSFDNCVSHKLSEGRKAAQDSTGRRFWQTQSLNKHLSSVMLSEAKHLWSISVRESV
jgi:hypothetical protein